MRLAGRITDWDDDRGYGFVVPNGGGERTFVHINEFQRGSRRPSAGDLISYRRVTDSRGRARAQDIRHAGQKIQPRGKASRVPRSALGAASLMLVVGLAITGMVPVLLAGAYLAASCLSYLLYFLDKAAASRGSRRIPENNLHLVDLFGGWPGALIAQQQFRHKTIKQPFQAVFWGTVALNLAGAWWLVRFGAALELARSLNG